MQASTSLRSSAGGLRRSFADGLRRCVSAATATATQRPSLGQDVAPRFAALPPVADLSRACRERLCVEHLGGGLVYLEAGEQQLRNGMDVFHPYRADSNFVYLTGVNEPSFACLVDTDTGALTLLAPKLPPEAAYWMGGLPSLDQLAEQYGAAGCMYTEDLKQALLHSPQFRGRAVHTTAALQAKLQDLLGAASQAPAAGAGGQQGAEPSSVSPDVIGGLLETTLGRCRAVKTDGEVACLLQANVASGRAHMDMWRSCRPGMYEYQLEAVFRYSSMSSGCVQLGYPCIVGAGRNSAILHYEVNRAQVCPGDLVLVDAGAEFRCYTADISRTFPASSTFSLAQKDVYNAVLAAQEHALGAMRSGVALSDVDLGSRKVILAHLLGMGMVRGSIEELLHHKVDRVFMPHGLSHFLGLDVHDVSSVGPVPKTLEIGHVITCEPGLYFIEPLIQKAASDPNQASLMNMDVIESFQKMGGVRIEDNVLIQDGGIFNITTAAGVPKTVKEIEEIMATRS